MDSDVPAVNYPDLPPFPDDVPTAPLLRLSLQKLVSGDAQESARLWKACTELGFFYLDLRGAKGTVSKSNGTTPNGHAHTNGNSSAQSSNADNGHTIDGDAYWEDAAQLFAIQEKFFGLPVEEKTKYDLIDEGSYFGYKGYGNGIIDKAGTRDRNEFYNISKDDILCLSPRIRAPAELDPYRPLFHDFITRSHAIVTLLLSLLSTHLDLPAATLPAMHDLRTASGDQVRWVRAPPQPPNDRQTALGAHTDFGSVTLLFNRLGGLQILPPGGDSDTNADWLYCRPLPGHLVCNLGDAMVKFTRGVLRSNTHRVVNPPGAQADSVRHSLVYFSRPNDEVLLKALQGSRVVDAVEGREEEGEVVSAKQHTLNRALGRRGVGDWKKSEGTEAMPGMKAMSGAMPEVAVRN